METKHILDSYLYLMTGKPHNIEVIIDPTGFPVKDAVLDDAYTIHVNNGSGQIVASNKRAALIAAYHLLRSCGCGFTRPGKSGEVIPSGLAMDSITAEIQVQNAHRFRGICIEGAVSLDIAIDMLEWMPKVGLNTYFMQFREGYTFFDRFYSARHNPSRMPLDFNLDVSRDIARRIQAKARELGLMYHGVGHGFHIECFGMNGLGWDQTPGVWPKEHEYAMALISGPSVGTEPGTYRRAMHWDIPMITALCYENETVQETVTKKAAEYIAAHGEYDYVHFWLDDGFANKCECDLCKGTRIADSYIKLLNKLDAKLSELGCDTKVVFLSYCETLWPPEREQLKNPNRFTFMFAPIARQVMQPLWPETKMGEIQPYNVNNQAYPENAPDLIAHLDAWNRYRRANGHDITDSFDFDYYNTRFNDPGQCLIAKTIYEDVTYLRQRGLNGVVNCQEQSIFADTALPMYVYAAALLQPERSYNEITNCFFTEAFSPEYGAICKRYFEELTALSGCLRNPKQAIEQDFSALESLLASPPKYAGKNIGVAESFRLLRFSMALYNRILTLKKARAAGTGALQAAVDAALGFAVSHAAQFEMAFDLYSFQNYVNKYLQKQGE